MRSFGDVVECAVVDTITLDKHPSLQGIRFALRLWQSNSACTHVVSEGDNLYRLAIQYDTTVEVLRRHNNLTTSELTIGQLLLLPSCLPEAASLVSGTEVCFAAAGRIALIDTATAERTIYTIQSYESAGMTCGTINRPGVVVLVASDSS